MAYGDWKSGLKTSLTEISNTPNSRCDKTLAPKMFTAYRFALYITPSGTCSLMQRIISMRAHIYMSMLIYLNWQGGGARTGTLEQSLLSDQNALYSTHFLEIIFADLSLLLYYVDGFWFELVAAARHNNRVHHHNHQHHHQHQHHFHTETMIALARLHLAHTLLPVSFRSTPYVGCLPLIAYRKMRDNECPFYIFDCVALMKFICNILGEHSVTLRCYLRADLADACARTINATAARNNDNKKRWKLKAFFVDAFGCVLRAPFTFLAAGSICSN